MEGSGSSLNSFMSVYGAGIDYYVSLGQTRPIAGGYENIVISFAIARGRVAEVNALHNKVIDGTEVVVKRLDCSFHFISRAGSTPSGGIFYASGENISPGVVGVWNGTVKGRINGEQVTKPCNVEISEFGKFTMTAPYNGDVNNQYVTYTGELKGRYFDTVGFGGSIGQIYGSDPNADGDSWNANAKIRSGVGISFSLEGTPARAIGQSGADPLEGTYCDIGKQSYDTSMLGWTNLLTDQIGQSDCRLFVGNPINLVNGNKYQREIDYEGGANVELKFERIYNSDMAAASSDIGRHWRHNYERTLRIVNSSVIYANRADGKSILFISDAGSWKSSANVNEKLRQVGAAGGASWILETGFGDIETYDVVGKLVSITNRQGRVIRLNYFPNGKLQEVVDQFGRSLRFEYDERGRIKTLTDPTMNEYRYGFDDIDNLISVTRPGHPNPLTKKYLYGDLRFPNAMTGIIDEKNVEFATWKYDEQGRAISSEHAGGVDKNTLVFSTNATTVTDPLLTNRTYRYNAVSGKFGLTGTDQPAGAGCSAATKNIEYDANGNPQWVTDFNGTKTQFTYDKLRNLEISRVEGYGTSAARVITTDWHPQYRLPIKIAQPKRLTINNYDANGNLLQRTEQATSDLTGASGLNPTTTGVARQWSYTYNGVGRVLTATDPNGNTTQYEYDGSGNLTKMTDALGRITSFSNFDASGRAGQIVAPNHLITTLTYWPDGLIKTKTVGTQVTVYNYNDVGQIEKIVFPDMSYLTYIYDDAHRLTDVMDSAGSNVHYILDNAGNRKTELTRDSAGKLTGQVNRQFDALNRLKEVSGAVQ
jgi:YD repeat-containing protein